MFKSAAFVLGIFGFLVSAHAAPFAGRLVLAEGGVSIVNTQGIRAARLGDEIVEQDTIRVASGGMAKILFTDRTIVDLKAGSEFKIEEYKLNQGSDRKVNLNLSQGVARTSVNQKVGDGGKFQFKTKAAVMGVRGTEFAVDASSNSITVFTGQVEVRDSKGAVQMVNSGQIARVDRSGGAKVAQASSGELQQQRQASQVTDQTFEKSTQTESRDRADSVAREQGPPIQVSLAELDLPGAESDLPPLQVPSTFLQNDIPKLTVVFKK